MTLRHNSGMDCVDVEGMRIAYQRAGSGPVLVMLHGAPTDSRTWRWMLPDLARDHTVIAAMLALSLFRNHPDVPASLALVGGYAGWAGSLPPDEVARRLKMFLGMAELGDAFDPKSYPGLFSERIPADREAALVAMMRENIRPPTVRAAGYIGAETDLRPVLPTVDVPTLVLHGAADARSPLANAEALHAAIPTSQLVVLPGLGHACVVEDPETCAAEIRRFVATVR